MKLEKGIPRDKLLYMLEREVARRSLYEFFKMATPVLSPSVQWEYNFHFEYITNIS